MHFDHQGDLVVQQGQGRPRNPAARPVVGQRETIRTAIAGANGDRASDGRRYHSIFVDLYSANGQPVAMRGELVTPGFLDELAKRRSPLDTMTTALRRTQLYSDMEKYLRHPLYDAIFDTERARFEAMRVSRDIQISSALLAEINDLAKHSPSAYAQVIVSSALAALLLRQRYDEEKLLQDAMLAFLLRDIGLSRVPRAVMTSVTRLSIEEYQAYMSHEISSGVLVARIYGKSLATWVAFHHHRNTPAERWSPEPPGYTREQLAAVKSVLQVAEAFVGMISPRTFRVHQFTPRGAVDALADAARHGREDMETVKLLVGYLRGDFKVDEIRMADRRTEPGLEGNQYGISR